MNTRKLNDLTYNELCSLLTDLDNNLNYNQILNKYQLGFVKFKADYDLIVRLRDSKKPKAKTTKKMSEYEAKWWKSIAELMEIMCYNLQTLVLWLCWVFSNVGYIVYL